MRREKKAEKGVIYRRNGICEVKTVVIVAVVAVVILILIMT